MILVYALCTLLLLLFEYHSNKDLKSPCFLTGVIWIFAYLQLLFFAPLNTNFDNLYYASFFVCFVFFFLGMNLFQKEEKISFLNYNFQYQWNPLLKNFVFILEYIFALIVFFKSLDLMSSSTVSAWRTLHWSLEEDDVFSTGYFGMMLNVVPVIFFVSFGAFLHYPNVVNKKDMLLSFPPVVLAMLFTSRGNWFFLILTVFYMSLFVKKVSNKNIVFLGLLSFVLIAWIWVKSSLDKFELAYGTMSDSQKLQDLFASYFVNPMLNFVEWFETGMYSGGTHTFRFFCAILRSLGFDFDVVPTVQPFLNINGTLSNVYTAVNWYAQDFGVWWAFIVYFILGLIYGFLYRKVKNENAGNLRYVIILSMLMMPIANQFFDEKIFSIFSIWCQRFIALFILTSPFVLVRKR